MKYPKEADSDVEISDNEMNEFFWSIGLLILCVALVVGVIGMCWELHTNNIQLEKPFIIVEKDTNTLEGGYKYHFQDKNGTDRKFYDKKIYYVGDTLK